MIGLWTSMHAKYACICPNLSKFQKNSSMPFLFNELLIMPSPESFFNNPFSFLDTDYIGRGAATSPSITCENDDVIELHTPEDKVLALLPPSLATENLALLKLIPTYVDNVGSLLADIQPEQRQELLKKCGMAAYIYELQQLVKVALYTIDNARLLAHNPSEIGLAMKMLYQTHNTEFINILGQYPEIAMRIVKLLLGLKKILTPSNKKVLLNNAAYFSEIVFIMRDQRISKQEDFDSLITLAHKLQVEKEKEASNQGEHTYTDSRVRLLFNNQSADVPSLPVEIIKFLPL
jgi:hypothetical protein